MHLPELRGELLTATVVDASTNIRVAGKKIAMSIPGVNNDFKILNTNPEGKFYASLAKKSNASKIYYKILGNSNDQYAILPDADIPINYADFEISKMTVYASDSLQILQRSIHNQIENGYANLKKDSLIPLRKTLNFNYKNAEVFKLDDFTRFPTFHETAIEILNNVWIDKADDGKQQIKIRSVNESDISKYPSMVLVDGVLWSYIKTSSILMLKKLKK